MKLATNLIMLSITFLTGYIIGKRVGYNNGFEKGKVYAPINLRIKMLEDAICPICRKDSYYN